MAVDVEILKRCQEDDQRAIKQLYEFCFQLLMPICVRYHTNREDARSSLNMAFLKIVQGLPTVDVKTLHFNSWAKKIMTNRLIDEYRAKKLYNKHYPTKETNWEIDSVHKPEMNKGLEKLEYNALLHLIEQVPENSRIVFNLFVIEGYSHQEISEMLDIPYGTSKWHLLNARKILKELVNKTTLNTRKHEFVG